MAEAAGVGALVAGAVNGARDAATLGAGVVPALRPWGTEDCPVLWGRGGPLSGLVSTVTLVSPLGALTAPVAHSPFPCFKRGTIRVVYCELRVE